MSHKATLVKPLQQESSQELRSVYTQVSESLPHKRQF